MLPGSVILRRHPILNTPGPINYHRPRVKHPQYISHSPIYSEKISPSYLKINIIAPMTSKGFSFPTRIQCTFQGKNGLILLDQMRAVDKSGLIQKLGVISKNAQIKTVSCLLELFAL